MGKSKAKPNYRRAVLRLPDLDHSKLAVLNSLTSPGSRRVYQYAIEQFIAWYCSEPRLAFNRIVVVRYRMFLEGRGLAANTINQQLAAVRRLAYEAADAGLLSPELAAGIARVKGVKQLGHRSGNWLSLDQSSKVLEHACGDSLRAKRDYAMLAMLLGCGLRRSELVGLETDEIQVRQDHWAIVDLVGTSIYNGMGSTDNTFTVNIGGVIVPNQQNTEPYTVTTANAIPNFSGGGGIEGVNGDAALAVSMTSGTPPAIGIAVLPDANATTASINGNYTLVDISAQLSTGDIYGYLATITLTNGVISGTYTQNMAGTITTGNPASGQWSVSNGVLTSVGSASGAVSADGDLIVLADTNSGDDPYINVAVARGTGVTPATFEGVYNVAEYGGTPVTATFGKAITVFAYGNGSYSITYTKNANGTITTNNTGTGSYTVTADGTLTLTDPDGDVYNGAISADGNALVVASVASQQNPAIFVGVRQ